MAAPLLTSNGALLLGMFATSFGIVMKSMSLKNTRGFLKRDNYYQNTTELANLKKRQEELASREATLRNNLYQVEKEINRANNEKNTIIQTEHMMRQCLKKGFALYDLLSILGTASAEELKMSLIIQSGSSISTRNSQF